MAASLPIVKPVSQIQLTAGSVVTIPNVSWNEFEAILQEFGEKRTSRIAYYQESLQIMVSLPEHEISKDLISDLVKILLKAKGKKYQPFGSTTFKKPGVAGIEPDACFYIDNYQSIIGRRRLQPDDPPPDLAIEIDVNSKTTLEAYEAIAIPELWIYNNSKLVIYLLTNGKYNQSPTSAIFPDIPITQIIPSAVARSWQVGSFQALEEFTLMMNK
ncbi:MAG TPA: Uma2 family endonuclease [Nostocaceae cyanobacterium]|nr:Uma2 family endonuclease [Nostocaceae cyanobacterium]